MVNVRGMVGLLCSKAVWTGHTVSLKDHSGNGAEHAYFQQGLDVMGTRRASARCGLCRIGTGKQPNGLVEDFLDMFSIFDIFRK